MNRIRDASGLSHALFPAAVALVSGSDMFFGDPCPTTTYSDHLSREQVHFPGHGEARKPSDREGKVYLDASKGSR